MPFYHCDEIKPGWKIDGFEIIAHAVNGEPFQRSLDGHSEPAQNPNAPENEHVDNERGNLFWVRWSDGRTVLACFDPFIESSRVTLSP